VNRAFIGTDLERKAIACRLSASCPVRSLSEMPVNPRLATR
jgi:hypothetical protein